MPIPYAHGPHESFDGVLGSKWYWVSPFVGTNVLVIPANVDRVALNFSVWGLNTLSRILYGGPTGSNGILMWKATLGKSARYFSHNIDNDPLYTIGAIWCESNFASPDIFVDEVWCCKKG